MLSTEQLFPIMRSQPKVSVSLITYNQEAFISQAIEGVLMQEVSFDYEIILSDDFSSDSTLEICRHYRDKHPDKIVLIERPENIGVVPNYLHTFQACSGEYIALLEGDDFWTDRSKLQKQVEFLDSNPDFIICCHNAQTVDANGEPMGLVLQDIPSVSTIRDLCKGDYIVTASCMVRNIGLDIPAWMFQLTACDWALDILHAQHGKIGYLDHVMAAYRVHSQSVWSGINEADKCRWALDHLQIINKGLDYRYTKYFQEYEQRLRFLVLDSSTTKAVSSNSTAADHQVVSYADYVNVSYELQILQEKHQYLRSKISALKKEISLLKQQHKADKKTIALAVAWQRRSWFKRAFHRWRPKARKSYIQYKTPESSEDPKAINSLDLIILDDAFPHPLSAFRFEEYRAYLKAIPNMEIHTTGQAFVCFGEQRSPAELIHDMSADFPELHSRVFPYISGAKLKARLAYMIFFGNVNQFLHTINQNKLPFVFTLYPGGAFELNNPAKDLIMKQVFQSPYFRHVITTQSITHEYLLKKNFCQADKITHINGVVTPQENLQRDIKSKRHYGRHKNTLDICFVAHKYSTHGEDKGYDVFIDVALELVKQYDDISFHVVGGFNETTLNTNNLGDRIHFYGMQRQEWFASFYNQMDIILSPNLPFKLNPGYFDGFPTGCCTDAALHGVAMFCTDLLELNQIFTDGRDIVLIPYSVPEILDRIKHYHANPDELETLAVNGYHTTKGHYSYEKQILPRLQLLQSLIQTES